MAELGRDEEVLLWARRGIAETNGWQVEKLYDLACGVYERRSAPLEVLRLRREQHEGMASASTYSLLRRAADAVGAWDIERDAARLALRERVPCATHCLETAQSLRSARRSRSTSPENARFEPRPGSLNLCLQAAPNRGAPPMGPVSASGRSAEWERGGLAAHRV